MMQRLFLKTAAILLLLAGAVQAAGDMRILAMGDSLMASYKMSGRSISNSIGQALGQRVENRATLGARMIYKLPLTGALGMSITRQFNAGDWDWVVLNGGGNDLLFGCGCRRCDRKMNKLISSDGRRGEIPELVSRLRQSGARVIYVGYLRSPGVASPIERCRDEGDELEGRISRLAALDRGIYFLSLAGLVPYGDRSYHGADMIHPSRKASAEIGRMVADIIAGSRQAQVR